MENKKIRILSIDGGGVRGIIPITILEEIEKRSGKKIYELFDLIAGTSSGGVISLALTTPDKNNNSKYTASDILKLYFEESSTVFQRSLLRQIFSLGNLIEEKYSSDGIKKVFNSYFENIRLSQTLTPVLITSYEIEKRQSFFFKTRYCNKSNYDYYLKDIALATSAAPTYFEPAKIKNLYTNKYNYLIDGGIFANNPAMCAYAEAKKAYPKFKNIFLLSLGTGKLEKPIKYENAKNWGLSNWARPLLEIVADGLEDTVNYQLKRLINKDRYHRFQLNLKRGYNSTDNTNPTYLQYLHARAKELIKNRTKEIDSVIKEIEK